MSEPEDEPEGPSVDLPAPEQTFDLTAGQLGVPPFDAALGAKQDWERNAGAVPGPGRSSVLLQEEPPVSPFGGPLPASAPVSEDGDIAPRFFQFVEPPPVTAPAASGRRAPQAGQHNWIPSGPRNVGGRISALAIHPTDPRTMYAGAASGGVYKTIDTGETWFPLPFWHDAPSLAIGAIGICRGDPLTVYVATGEVKTGGAEAIPGNGVYRSDDAGLTWANAAVPPVPGVAPNQAFVFEAIAVHPTQKLHCWAVGPAGVFRTLDGGSNWTQFEAGVHYSDVVFSTNAAGNPIVYLVRATTAGAFAIRLDNPTAAGQPAISAAANRSRIAAAPAPAPPAAGVVQQAPDFPARAKIAICASRPDIAYARVATESGGDFGVFRTRAARNAPMSGAAWVRLASHLDWPDEGQGTYNLSIAVDPGNANNVATGMVDFYLSRNANAATANVRWLHAMAWELYQLDRAHHGDHHAVFFAPQPGAAAGTPPTLWVANDGGVAASFDWSTGAGYEGHRRRPLGVGLPPIVRAQLTLPLQGVDGNGAPIAGRPISWRKRSHGVSAAQMYDLTQSPLVPALYGCGFQDNGVYVTSGAETWHFVLGADGGFVAFDPDDPYRFVATWQGGIAEVEFTGRLLGYFPAPGDGIVVGVWPRVLHEGFVDGAAFVADTAYHPRKSGRVLHTRVNRLYGMPATGERWQPEQVGPGLELLYSGTAARPQLEVLPSVAAQHLGLLPQLNAAAVRSYLLEPFALAAGEQLSLQVDGNPLTVTFNPGGAIPNLGAATAAQVAAYIRANVPAALPTVNAQPYFPPTGLTVEIMTRGVGAAQQITLGGSALAPLAPGGVPPLGLLNGTYAGAVGRPAAVTLGFPGETREDFVRNRNLTGLELTVQVNGGPVRHIPFAPPAFPDPAWVRTGELRAAIAAACAADPVDVASRAIFKSLRITDTGGAGVTLTDTATGRLNVPAGGGPFAFVTAGLVTDRDRFLNQNVGNFGSFDLSPPAPAAPLQLVINDNTAPPSPPLVFNAAAGAANLRCVTIEELQRILTAHIAAIPAANRPQVRFDVVINPDPGKPRSIRYAEGDPDVVWVGGEDGVVYVSTNDGGSWTQRTDPRFRLRDRSVEAIAIDPRDHRTVYLGLAGRTHAVAGDPGFLWKTTDSGVRWDPIGAEVVDAAGVLVGVNALELDPAAPDTVFAATDVGVFRSVDAGAHWAPFNEGLPNVFIRDLAFSPATRMLRAGAWGRGVYERHVGDLPPQDVRLYARANRLDDGTVRPAPEGPDLFATTPTGAGPASPDIKVARDRPPGIGADDLVDGVEFDEDIVHESPVAGPARVFVQVHNRGAFPASEVRLVALWTDATNSAPPLPADFWAKYSAGGAISAALAPWTLIGDTRAGAALTVAPGYPQTHTFDVVWPAELDGMRRIGILLLVSGKEDVLAANALDLPTLLAGEAKIAYRESPVVRAADDRTLFLKQTGPVQFTVANPAAGTAAPANLGIAAAALGVAVAELTGGTEPFNLAPSPQALAVSTPAQVITIPLVQGANDIPALAAAQIWEVAAVVNRELQLAGVPARAEIAPTPLPAPPVNNFQWSLVLRGTGSATVAVAPPPGGAVDAAPLVGWAAAPAAARVVGAPGPYVLPAGSAIQITATNTATIALAAADFANPANATAREVRRALNRGLAEAELPVRASVPQVDLRIRRSSTDADGAPAAVAGRRLADLAVAGAAVAPAARPALFGLLELQKPPLVQAAHDGFLYVRTANLGTAAEPAARHRVFQLAMGPPIAPAPIGAAVPAQVQAGGSAIVELPWNPGAAAAGDRLFVLAVADVDTDGRRLDPPASFASIEELDAFCNTNTNAAYREFTVGP